MNIDYPTIVMITGESTSHHYIINSPDQLARLCHATLMKLASDKYFLHSEDFINNHAEREIDNILNSDQYLDDDDREIALNTTMESAQSLPEPFKSAALDVLTYVKQITDFIIKEQEGEHAFNANVKRVLDAGEDGWKIPSDTARGYLVIDLLDYVQKTRNLIFKTIPVTRFED